MSQMGVYRLYGLARVSNGFTTEIKTGIQRDLHVITNDYANSINENSTINGLLYEKDENATKLYLDGKPFKNVKEFTDFEDVKEDSKDLEKEALQKEYEELKGEKPKMNWSVKRLTEEIEKLKTID